MDTGDAIALAIAGSAVAVGALIAAIVVYKSPAIRHRIVTGKTQSAQDTMSSARSPDEIIHSDTPPRPAGEHPPDHDHDPEPLSVAILSDEDGNHRWRVTVSPTSDRITVDVFSFRPADTNGDSPWQHELLTAPVHVAPGHGVSVGAPVDPSVAYSLSISWTSHHPDGDHHASRLMHIPVSELRGAPFHSAASRPRPDTDERR